MPIALFTAALAFAGAVLSAYLGFISWASGALPGCGVGSGCSQVLASGYGRVGGVPVGWLAAGVYLAGGVGVYLAGPSRSARQKRMAAAIRPAAAGALLAAAAWFVYLQIGVIGDLCVYCDITHAIGVTLAFLLLWRLPPSAPATPGRSLARAAWAAGGVGLVAAMALGQVLRPAPTAAVHHASAALPEIDTGPGPDRVISVLAQKVRFNPHRMPVLGSADAPRLAVELVDYTCEYCRGLNDQMREVRGRLGTRLGVLIVPVPLCADCNPLLGSTPPGHETACELAELALAVWKHTPQRFEAFHEYLMSGESPPTPQAARAWLTPRGGVPPVGAWAKAQLRRNIVGLWQIAGGRPLPLLILGPTILQGRPATPDELERLVKENLK